MSFCVEVNNMGSWNRETLEEYLAAAYQAAGTEDFTHVVPEADMSAVLLQLQHLKKLGRLTSFNRRNAQQQEGFSFHSKLLKVDLFSDRFISD